MSEVQLDFPDLDGALAVSRVEVVSNVEVAAIKGALRWVFEELQRQHAAKQLSDAAALQQQIQDALSACKEQKAAIESLQDRQEQLAKKADKANEEMQVLQQSPAPGPGAQPAEQGATGVQDLTQLQQQLQSLADNQAELAKEVAALKQSSPIPAGTSPSDTAATATPSFASIGDTAAPNTSEGSNSPAAGTALSPDASDPASGVQLVGNMAAQLSALTAEVTDLKADVQALGKGSIKSGGTNVDTTAPPAAAEQLPTASVSDRLHELTADKIAEVSAALSALQQQMQGQATTVGDLSNASGELKRLLADKASLAEVQAVLKAQAGPTTLPVAAGGKVDMADVAGAVNGLGSKLASLEALLALTQQRIADKADTAELDSLRAAIAKIKAAIGDDTVPVTTAGTNDSSDAADVVPAECESPADSRKAGQAGPSSGVVSGSAPPGSAPPKLALPGNALPGAAPQGAHPSNPLPGSISARLATLERDVSSANRASQTSGASGTGASAAPTSSSSTAASIMPESDLSSRVAVLESGFSRLSQALPSNQQGLISNSGYPNQPMQLSSAGAAGSTGAVGATGAAGTAGISSAAGSAGISSAAGSAGIAGPAGPAGSASAAGSESGPQVQSDAAVLSHLQVQIEELKTGKADKAGLEALQLRAAASNGGASLSNSKPGDTGDLSGLLDTVQKMIGGKADKEELQALKRLLGDKVNLADHQAAVNNLERSVALVQTQPGNARMTAGSSAAGPNPTSGSPLRGPAGGPRGSGAFMPVRPGRRTLQDENQVPLGELGSLREEFQQLKAAVEVLTNATHLMAIPSANKPSSPPAAAAPTTSGASEAAISTANPGMATPNPSAATSVGTGATAAAGVPAAAASAAAALAGLHDAAPPSEAGTGPSGRLGGQHHVVTGLTSQKQVTGASTQQGSQTEPGAPAASPRAGSNPSSALSQSAGAIASTSAALQGAAGLNGSGPLQELMTHMEAGQLGHKMNDSDIYEQLAQRLAALERLVRRLTQQAAGGQAHPVQGNPGGAKDRPDERLLRRLGSDLAVLKKRVDEMAPPKDLGTVMMRDGDHAMLAAKPLQGYRCMACDRPLAKLDPDMGGFIPAAPMTVSVAMDVSKNNGIVLSKDAASKIQGKKGGMTPQQSRTSIFPGPPHSGEDPVGPQNWFKEAHGQPAEALAREDVGPHLPPGGWRAGAPQANRGSPRSPHKTQGSARMADEEELAAWESQATVPLPDIHTKTKA